jgi:YHS domain-containing protein
MFAFLARLILFLVAISVIRSVIGFVQRAFSGVRPPSAVRGPSETASAGTPSSGTPSTTMLQQDPVCGTYVAVDSSLKRVVHGKVIHFCSAECRDKYSF